MYKLWKWDGHYIQGELISSHTTEAAALKKAKKEKDSNAPDKKGEWHLLLLHEAPYIKV